MRGGIGRTRSERKQIAGDIGEVLGDRELAAEQMQLLQIMMQRQARLKPECAAHHLGGDEGIAVAIAADPASHAQK